MTSSFQISRLSLNNFVRAENRFFTFARFLTLIAFSFMNFARTRRKSIEFFSQSLVLEKGFSGSENSFSRQSIFIIPKHFQFAPCINIIFDCTHLHLTQSVCLWSVINLRSADFFSIFIFRLFFSLLGRVALTQIFGTTWSGNFDTFHWTLWLWSTWEVVNVIFSWLVWCFTEVFFTLFAFFYLIRIFIFFEELKPARASTTELKRELNGSEMFSERMPRFVWWENAMWAEKENVKWECARW